MFPASVAVDQGMGWRRTQGQGVESQTRRFLPHSLPTMEGEEMEVLGGHQANLDMGPGDSAFRRLGRDRKGWWAEGKGPQGHQLGGPRELY